MTRPADLPARPPAAPPALPPAPPARPEPVPLPSRVLRRLFLTLFLRGRSSRGLKKENAPSSVGQKLAMTLGLYALVGLFAAMFAGRPVFALSVYLHGATFLFLGMFVASSAGEILFNKEEAEILLHRPIEPRALLWAKVRVLTEVSLWLAGAFNLVGFFVGLGARDARPGVFPFAHALSTALEALFCTGSVVLVYQLCLRWFGRERLDGLMTTAQVLVSIGVVLAGQILPRVTIGVGGAATATMTSRSWWLLFLPPAWFAGLDDALAGSGARGSWALALAAVAATGAVAALAFGKLAGDYQSGLQLLGESAAGPPRRAEGDGSPGAALPPQRRRRALDALADLPPLRWWLRDPVVRASFLLTAAYLLRDRDVKLRVFPGIAPMLVMPIVMMFPAGRDGAAAGSVGAAVGAGFIGILPLMALNLLQFSQQWQAADVFRAAPTSGPAPFCQGARRAVLCFVALPTVLAFAVILLVMHRGSAAALLPLIPAVIALPVFSLVAHLGGHAVPLSVPAEEAKSAGRGLIYIAVTMASLALAGLAAWARHVGWFWQFVLGEALLAVVLCLLMRHSIRAARWTSAE